LLIEVAISREFAIVVATKMNGRRMIVFTGKGLVRATARANRVLDPAETAPSTGLVKKRQLHPLAAPQTTDVVA
jgi:hypothetical protein